jgi:hypothetical protein
MRKYSSLKLASIDNVGGKFLQALAKYYLVFVLMSPLIIIITNLL